MKLMHHLHFSAPKIHASGANDDVIAPKALVLIKKNFFHNLPN